MTARSERDGRQMHWDAKLDEWVFDDTDAIVSPNPQTVVLCRIAAALETLAACVDEDKAGPFFAACGLRVVKEATDDSESKV